LSAMSVAFASAAGKDDVVAGGFSSLAGAGGGRGVILNGAGASGDAFDASVCSGAIGSVGVSDCRPWRSDSSASQALTPCGVLMLVPPTLASTERQLEAWPAPSAICIITPLRCTTNRPDKSVAASNPRPNQGDALGG